ncbi:DUF4391 domain-containing protein [Acidiphilium sp.]|uniref:DUF4391 domain-containing protein n=1 Tax=Acidiphilium sp. TaxID=527 RepID=UPI00258E155E|nr:DUF4391 domain-containing protein [Acidiphilium sp.]
MSGSPVTLDALIAAFALPAHPPPRRVPKASLADNAPTAADRRLIDGKLARLEWVAALNPATTGIASATSEGLEVGVINLLAARTRGPMPPRLAEIVQRAIPQPVILVHADETADAPAALSLAPKRAAEREAGRVVVKALHDSGELRGGESDFLATLALSRLPSRDLVALYAGLVERVEALIAARAGGRPFRLPSSPTELGIWREALAQIDELETQIAARAAAMRKEVRLATRVEQGEAVRQLRAKLDKCRAMLE